MLHINNIYIIKYDIYSIYLYIIISIFISVFSQVIQDSDKAHGFATLVLTSSFDQINDISDTSLITVKSLNSTLVQSANFYEAKCMHSKCPDFFLRFSF